MTIIGFVLLCLTGVAVNETIQPVRVPLVQGEMRVYMLDVEQGDAFLIHTSAATVLIDGGEPEQGDGLVQKLRALGVESLDYVINSHPHSDHFGGLTTVLETIPVETLYMPDFPESLTPTAASYFSFLNVIEKESVVVTVPENGETLVLGDAVVTFLCVDNSEYSDLNDCSLLCRLDHGENSFLFCGDLTATGERDFVEQGLIAPVDVLKCAHHGSNSSSCATFLAAASPEYVAIPVGEDNDYGHPSMACLERLYEYTNAIYRTDVDNDVLFSSDGAAITVITDYRADLRGKEVG